LRFRVSAGSIGPYPWARTLLLMGAIRSFGCLPFCWSFGHEFWRRIWPALLPLQIPRALAYNGNSSGFNAKSARKDGAGQKLPPIPALGRHYGRAAIRLVVRSGLCGGCCSSWPIRLVLAGCCCSTGSLMVAITVGIFSAASLGANYFCPMAPVESVYSTPSGWLGSKATTSEHGDHPVDVRNRSCRMVRAERLALACPANLHHIRCERDCNWAALAQTHRPGLDRYGYRGGPR